MAVKYKWLAERLEMMIEKQLKNGILKLPTEQELCVKYHVSRQTVRMALSLLEQKGMIIKKQGSGCYLTGLSQKPEENVIGILISSDQDYLYPGLLEDIKNRLSENGFSTQVFVTGNCVFKEREILAHLLKNPLRGILAEGCKTALPNPNLDFYRRLRKSGCQIVFLHSGYPGLGDCPCLGDDNYNGSSLLVRHLADLGHTAIGGIFKADDMQGMERYQGCLETLSELGLPFPDEHFFWYGSRELEQLIRWKNTHFLSELAKTSLSFCTAVICQNDCIAYYLIRELLKAGVTLPSRLAVAAFNNTYYSRLGTLSITALSHKPHEMGTKAAEMILKKLSGLPAASQEIRWELLPKESTSAGR